MFQKEEKISAYQAVLLALSGGTGLFIAAAQYSVVYAGRDGWLSLILAFMISVFLLLMLVDLHDYFKDKTIIEYLPLLYGQFWGSLISFVYILFYIVVGAVVVRGTAEQLRPIFMETPHGVICFITILSTAVTLKLGIEVFVRVLEYIVPTSLILLILCFIFLLPDLDLLNLTPVLENGIGPVLRNVPLMLTFPVHSILFMATWLPCLDQPKQGRRVGIYGLGVACLILLLIIVMVISYAGVNLTKVLLYPVYQMFQYIVVVQYLVGFEGVFLLLWAGAAYYLISNTAYPVVIGCAKLLRLKDYKPIIFPLGMIVFAVSLLPLTPFENRSLNIDLIYLAQLPLALLIIISWIIMRLRKSFKR